MPSLTKDHTQGPWERVCLWLLDERRCSNAQRQGSQPKKPRPAQGWLRALFLTINDDNFDAGYTVPGGHERPQARKGLNALKGLHGLKGLESFEAEGATRA